MSAPLLRRLAVVAIAGILAACAAPRPRPSPPDAALLDRQAAREQALAAHAAWTLHGRLGVSDARDSGSGALEWTQDGDTFRFSVHAPVTGKTWVLAGDAHHARLEGLRSAAVEGDDAAALLERELGWRVPLAELADWVRGMRAAGPARVTFRGDGLPAEIDQAGWTVQYPDYDTRHEPALPRKVFAVSGDRKVRLAISAWTLR